MEDLEIPCKKIQPISYDVDMNNALIFLKLKKEGCNTKNAVNFSQRIRCKVDSTQKIDGPNNYKIL